MGKAATTATATARREFLARLPAAALAFGACDAVPAQDAAGATGAAGAAPPSPPLPPPPPPPAPPRYPAHYPALVAAAVREGAVVVDATTDLAVAGALIEDFNRLHPKVAVDYREAGSAEIHDRFLRRHPGEAGRADVLWSSAMDLQVKLVNDGHAQRYSSPEASQLPAWAVWRDEAYGTTVEPVGFAYSRRHLAPHEVPSTRRDLVRLIESDRERFRDRVVTYDLEASGLGFLFATQDARTSDLVWEVARALGSARAKEVSTSAAMLQSLAAGESVLAYNVLGTYAQARLRADAAVGFVLPRDYTLVGTRIAFIARGTAHPNAARLWLDHLLSHRGQTVLARRSGLLPIRADVEPEPGMASLRPAASSLRPVAIGPSLMTYLDRSKRQAFLKQWRQALGRA